MPMVEMLLKLNAPVGLVGERDKFIDSTASDILQWLLWLPQTALAWAAWSSAADVVQVLIDAGADVKQTFSSVKQTFSSAKHSAIMFASSRAVAELLVAAGADLCSFSKEDGFDVMLTAARVGDVEYAKWLEEHGVAVNCYRRSRVSPLHVAALGGHLDFVKWLMSKAIPVNRSHSAVFPGLSHVDAVANNGVLPIHCAAAGGHIEVAVYLKENGSIINSTRFARPLNVAANCGHLDFVKWLREQGVALNSGVVKGDGGKEAIHEAAEGGHLLVLEYLVENGVDVRTLITDDVFVTYNALHFAAKGGHLDVAKWLVLRDIEEFNMYDKHPIHFAAEGGHVEFAVWLCESLGADVEVASGRSSKSLPLHFAAGGGHFEFVVWLLKSGAHVQPRNDNGKAPLHFAAEGGHVAVAKLLVKHGADANLRDRGGRTPFHCAAANGQLEFAKWLKAEEGVDVFAADSIGSVPRYAADSSGMVPLHFAAQGGLLDFAKWLAELTPGALNFSVCDKSGKQPLHFAAEGVHVEFAKWLVKLGADINATVTTKIGPSTSVHFAVDCFSSSSKRFKFIQWLASEGVDLDLDRTIPLARPEQGRAHPLILAAVANGSKYLHISDQLSATIESYLSLPHCSAGDVLCAALEEFAVDCALAWLRDFPECFYQRLDGHSGYNTSFEYWEATFAERCLILPKSVATPILKQNAKNNSAHDLKYKIDLLPFELLVVTTGEPKAFDILGVQHADRVFPCGFTDESKVLTPLDVALDFRSAAMVVHLLQLGASMLKTHTAEDIMHLLGRVHTSFMVIGRWQSGKTRVVEHLVSFVRRKRFLGFTIRKGSRPVEKKRDVTVRRGDDENATEGFELHNFNVSLNPDEIEKLNQSNSSLVVPSPSNSGKDSGRSPPQSPRGSRLARFRSSTKQARMEVGATLFDFGGQDEYRHFHPIFFNSRTLYVVVFNLERLVEAVEYNDDGHVVHSYRGTAAVEQVKIECMEWLHSVRPPVWHASSDSSEDIPRVFLIGTHWDAIKKNERVAVREACNDVLRALSDACMETCELCCATKRIASILNVEEDVHNRVLNSQGVYKLALHGNASKEEDRDVKRLRIRLVAMSLADSRHSLMPEEGAKNEFATALKEAKLEIEQAFKDGSNPTFSNVVRAIDIFSLDVSNPLFERTCIFLKDKGDIFYFVKEDGTFAQDTKFIILSPEWLSRCLAKLVHVATGKIQGSDAYFQDGAIHLMDTRKLWSEYIQEDVELERLQFFMDLLVHVGVCVQVPKTPSLYVFPLLIGDSWPSDEEERYRNSIQSLKLWFGSPTAARRILFDSLLELMSRAKHEERLGAHRFYVDRFKDAYFVQADPDPSYQIAVFVVLHGNEVNVSFGRGAEPFIKRDNGTAEVAIESLGWNVCLVLCNLLGQDFEILKSPPSQKLASDSSNYQKVPPPPQKLESDSSNFQRVVGTSEFRQLMSVLKKDEGKSGDGEQTLVESTAGCLCQDVVLHIGCAACLKGGAVAPFYFTFKSLEAFLGCIRSNELPHAGGVQVKPVRCEWHRAAQSSMSDLLLWQVGPAASTPAAVSAAAAAAQPSSAAQRKLKKRASVYDLKMDVVSKLGGNEAAARFKIYLQTLLENVFHAYKTIASGKFDEKALASNDSASLPLRLFGDLISLVPLVGDITNIVLQRAADGVEAYKKHRRFNVAKNLSELPLSWQAKVIDEISLTVAERYSEQLARLATPAEVSVKGGRFSDWLRGVTGAAGKGVAVAIVAAEEDGSAAAAAAEDGDGEGGGASGVELLKGVGGTIVGELAPSAGNAGATPPKQAAPFEKTLAEYTSLWLIESLESFDVGAGDILDAPGRLVEHLFAALDALKPESEPQNGRIARFVRRVKRPVGAERGGVVVYAHAAADASAYVEWTVHGFLTAPGVATDDGARYGSAHTRPQLYGYRRGTKEEAERIGLTLQ